ncbi:MAG: dockerin type I repeat-containing protein [candidate division Zixibacteria bacterium]|nr:dockerin type I repeat-containing protein [candidate division Zixibacteria bacterium]
MQTWRKRIQILVIALSVLVLGAIAFSDSTPEQEKAETQAQINALRSTADQAPIHPDVAAKWALEEEIAAKIAAEEAAAEEEEAQHAANDQPKLATASRPAVQENLKVNPFRIQPVMPAQNPKYEILLEGFEGGVVPPADWTAVVNNPYTFEIDDYNPYEGAYNTSCYYDETYTSTQDEWLISPVMDLTGKTNWKLKFAWLGSYYWSNGDYDNYDMEAWISTDGGANFTTKLWCEEDAGEFVDWTWYEETIDLSAYSTESTVKIAFRYYGYDGAQFSVDMISIDDEEYPVGRCCYGDPSAPSCEDVTELDCEGLGGYSWFEGLDCTADPCPVAGDNDECVNAELISSPFPTTVSGTTEGATIDCPGVLDWNAVWYKFDAPNECNDVVIDYCGSPYEIQCIGAIVYTACGDCENYILRDNIEWLDCEGVTQPKLYWDNLPGPATYYIPVFIGDADCNSIGSPFQFTLDVSECPPPEPGDNCNDPFVVSIGSGDLPYTIANQYTCGRSNNYDATCLDYYDGGEDLIVELNVADAMDVKITLDPKGTTYSGIAISNGCPDDGGTCIGSSTNSGSDPHTINSLSLVAGTYYIIVDTWPSPDCIPDLDIIIEPMGEVPEGANCANPIKVDLPGGKWSDIGQTTCGMLDDYDATCLGSYDGGEDIIYEITVISAVTVNFLLDPLGTTYTGMALSTDCPGADPCLYESTEGGSSPHGFNCVSLDPGVYYLMVDTWPSPDCIPEFDLFITDTTCDGGGELENDDCADAIAIGEVMDLAFSTEEATVDGPEGCQYAPNIWYCYTATETGDATITLCGSDYDTKMAVYDGCSCDPIGAELGCNDDSDCEFKALQSTVVTPVVAGNSYLIEVGGYSSSTGPGVLSIWVEDECIFECPPGSTPEGEPCIADDGEDVTNGGCNSVPPVFGSIECGETVCGTVNTYLYTGLEYRDTDWYSFTLDTSCACTLTFSGNFPFVSGFLEQFVPGGGLDCGNFTGSIAPYAVGDGCEDTIVIAANLSAGEYAVFAGATVYNGLDCPGFEYWMNLECTPVGPTYCEASGGCDEYIENVTVGEINNTTGCDYYGDYTALCATMEAGGSYPISITIGNSYSSDTGAVYVDWNQDFDFDDPGEMAALNPGAGEGPYAGIIDVPVDAAPGTTRMRVRVAWNTDPGPCGVYTYGEVEDYCITLGDPPPTWIADPDTVFTAVKFTLEPVAGAIYITTDAVGGIDVNTITGVAMNVGATALTITSEVVTAPYPLTGDALKVTYDQMDLVIAEETVQGGLVWGHIDSFFDVTFNEGGPFSGFVAMRGHTPGDLNLDGAINIADLTYMVAYLFTSGPDPQPMQAADVNASGGDPNIADLTHLVAYLFNGGSDPVHQ